jgi:Trypsin
MSYMCGAGLSDFDIGLLYLKSPDLDYLLPPNPSAGSAMLVSLKLPSSSATLTLAGFGQTALTGTGTGGGVTLNDLHLSIGTEQGVTQSLVQLNNVAIPPQAFNCKGDSGGPLVGVNSNSTGVIVGVTSAFFPVSGNTNAPCAMTGDTIGWARTDLEEFFIEKAIRDQTGLKNFSCTKLGPVGSEDSIQCWGQSCTKTADCPSGPVTLPALDGGVPATANYVCRGTPGVVLGAAKPPGGIGPPGCPPCGSMDTTCGALAREV